MKFIVNYIMTLIWSTNLCKTAWTSESVTHKSVTYPTRTWAVGNYGVVDLECKKQVLLWACLTPTKSNCWCRLRTAGGVPTPHGSAVKSQCFFLFLLHILYRALLLQCCICFIFKPQHCSLGVIVYLYWIFHINEISIVLDVYKEKKIPIIMWAMSATCCVHLRNTAIMTFKTDLTFKIQSV